MAQATRTELVKRQQQQQQVSTTSVKPKATLKCDSPRALETNTTNTSTTSSSGGGGSSGSKTKPSYKHIPHSQKPAHLVAKRNARERRRVKAVNEAFNTLKKCVPIQNRNKRVSKVKTLQRAIDHIRHLQALLEADNEAGGAGGAETQRILISSKAGEEAELRLAMSPEPRRRPASGAATKVTKTNNSASSLSRQQVDGSHFQQQQRQRRGRKPNAIKQQEAAMKQQQQQQENASVHFEQQQQQQLQNQHYLIETGASEYATVPHGATPSHYYSLPEATCHSVGNSRAYADSSLGHQHHNQNHQPHTQQHHHQAPQQQQQQQQQQHYQGYENGPHYYQPAFHEQYQPQAANYAAHFYPTASDHHQVPYGSVSNEPDSSASRQNQQQAGISWQAVQSSSGSSRSSGVGGLATLDSPASSANLTQLMCNLNTSNSSSECSSSGLNATPSCLYNGAASVQHQPHRRAMPADSTTPSNAANNNNSNNANNTSSSSASSNKSLIDSPYSTTSSTSSSSFSSTSCSSSSTGTATSLAVNAGATNKSLDASAPLNLKHTDKASASATAARPPPPPTSAGSRQQVNNYANNYALPTFVYDPHARQPDEGAKLFGQHQHEQLKQEPRTSLTHLTNFICVGESAASGLYLASDVNEHQRQQQQHEQRHQQAGYEASTPMEFQQAHQAALVGLQSGAPTSVLYEAPALL